MKLKKSPPKFLDRPRPADPRRAAEARVSRATAGRDGGSLRIQWGRLADADAAELLALCEKSADGELLDLRLLTDRERRRWEELAATASGLPANVFEHEREMRELQSEMRRLSAEVARPPQKHRDLLPAGCVVLPATLGEDCRTGRLWVNHLTVIAALNFMFESGIPWTPSARFEGTDSDGDLALVVSRRHGFLGRALGEDDVRLNVWTVLEEVAADGWFTIDGRGGNELRIRRGAKSLAVGRKP
jgi:hypothetical protein